jgi:hypothetical protein
MKNYKGFTIVEFLVVVVFLVGLVSWFGNAYKLSQCDFEPNYKCEVVHLLGIVPILSVVTVWFDTDETKGK